jgi:hypothetical protein
MEHRVRRRDHRQRQGQAEDADDAVTVAYRYPDVEQCLVHGGARTQAVTALTDQSAADLGTAGVILHRGEAVHGDLGVRDDAAVGGDEGDASAGRTTRASHEIAKALGRGGVDEQRPRLVVEEGPREDQPRLERVGRERFESPVQIESGHEHAQPDEADQRERELHGDATPDQRGEPHGPASNR